MKRSSTILITLLLGVTLAPPVNAQNSAPDRGAPTLAQAAAPMNAASRKRVIEAVLARMKESYVFPRKVPGIAKALRSGSAGKYRVLSDPQKFADAVNADIEAVANDRHMRLFWSADALPPMPDPSRIDPKRMKQQTEFMARRNYAIRSADVLDGNVGYLKINGFLPPEVAGPALSAAMAFLKNSDAMIIDLRSNGGGDPSGVAMLVSYFVPADTLINTFHRRDKPVDDQVWTMPYVPGGRWSTDKPLYVLTSSDTASGAEEFAYDIQQLRRGTVVGASTWGGANPGRTYSINDHFAVFVPFGSAVNPISGTNWEGTGVKPDVFVAPADALDTAHRLALDKLLQSATGERRAELQDFIAPRPKR